MICNVFIIVLYSDYRESVHRGTINHAGVAPELKQNRRQCFYFGKGSVLSGGAIFNCVCWKESITADYTALSVLFYALFSVVRKKIFIFLTMVAIANIYKILLRYILFLKLHTYSSDLIFMFDVASMNISISVRQYLSHMSSNNWIGTWYQILILLYVQTYNLTRFSALFVVTKF